mmetsp:Transcript_22445/g.49052  ORF Transcript_22445/g.49052 Transcript_22445/m.49052 type:complete len:193 (-) Transcript_22445:40-618(-)
MCTPGERIGHVSEFQAGDGTYVERQFIYASTVGEKQVQDVDGAKVVVVVPAWKKHADVPDVGDLVTGQVLRLQKDRVELSILTVNDRQLNAEYRGVVRLQDIRQYEVDKLDVLDCFRPGDIVAARVLSLGDVRNFLLSTAEDQLGVVKATSINRHPMSRVSWQLMQCTGTGYKERRKVAKPPGVGGPVRIKP